MKATLLVSTGCLAVATLLPNSPLLGWFRPQGPSWIMTTGPLVPENELTVVERGSVEPRQAQYHRRSFVNVSLGETEEDAPTKLLSGSGFFVIGNLASLPAMFHLPLNVADGASTSSSGRRRLFPGRPPALSVRWSLRSRGRTPHRGRPSA